MPAVYSPTIIKNPGSRHVATSPDFFSGQSLIQHEINSLPPIFSLEEERLRKHLYLNELFISLEKGGKGGSVKAVITDTYLIAD